MLNRVGLLSYPQIFEIMLTAEQHKFLCNRRPVVSEFAIRKAELHVLLFI